MYEGLVSSAPDFFGQWDDYEKVSMILSRHTPVEWRAQLKALLSRWIKRALPESDHGNKPVAVVTVPNDHLAPTNTAASDPHQTVQVIPSGGTARALSPDRDPQAKMTPQAWFRSLDPHTSIVAFIDHPSCQLMEMVALDTKQTTSFFHIPCFADAQAEWLCVGQRRLQRKHFGPATLFAEQEDALTGLEDLLAARWHATTELSKLDQDVLFAFDKARGMVPSTGDVAECVIPDTEAGLLEMSALLSARKAATAELAELDIALISALHKLGVALPKSFGSPD